MKLLGFKWKAQCVYQAPLSWQDFGSKLCLLGIRQRLKTPFKYLANQMLFYDFFLTQQTYNLVLSQWYEMNLYLYLVCILLWLNPLGDFPSVSRHYVSSELQFLFPQPLLFMLDFFPVCELVCALRESSSKYGVHQLCSFSFIHLELLLKGN